MLNDYRTFTTSIVGYLTNWFFKSTEKNVSYRQSALLANQELPML